LPAIAAPISTFSSSGGSRAGPLTLALLDVVVDEDGADDGDGETSTEVARDDVAVVAQRRCHSMNMEDSANSTADWMMEVVSADRKRYCVTSMSCAQ
jgi:hypothetical protein